MGGFFWHGYCCMMLNRILTGFILDLPILNSHFKECDHAHRNTHHNFTSLLWKFR